MSALTSIAQVSNTKCHLMKRPITSVPVTTVNRLIIGNVITNICWSRLSYL